MITLRGRGKPRVIMTLALLLSLAAPALTVPPVHADLGAAAEALGPPVGAGPRWAAAVTTEGHAPPDTGRAADVGDLRSVPDKAEASEVGDTGSGTEASPGGGARAIDAEKVTERLDRYLAGRPGPVTAMVEDLTTGRVYRYRHRRKMITASTSKVQILMGLLIRTEWKRLPKAVRRDAEIMIRYSDNHAADRLWLKLGGAPGFTEAGRKLGLRHTHGIPGACVDLYCWGITSTSAEDQVRLVKALTSDGSPLKAGERERVLRLMGEVVDGQDWGISAARCPGDTVALKNGWLRRVSTGRWAVVSAGLVRGGGHDYAIAVLTEGSAEAAYGIATVEGVTERIMRSFRRCPR